MFNANTNVARTALWSLGFSSDHVQPLRGNGPGHVQPTDDFVPHLGCLDLSDVYT